MPYLIRADGKRVLVAWSETEMEYLKAASTMARGELKAAIRDISAITGRPFETIHYKIKEMRAEERRSAKAWLDAALKKNWMSESRFPLVITPTMTRPIRSSLKRLAAVTSSCE